jgi:phosphonoacetaldehyde hydrolase
MGMHKKDHIRSLLQMPRIADEWNRIYDRPWNEADIDEMFSDFIPLQMKVIEKYSEIVPELLFGVEEIRKRGMKIGSTTGYNNEMMTILTSAASRQGYSPDVVVCATDVTSGRPAPWMAFRNAELMGIYPMRLILKIGDTISDIEEGINAGMWSVGVISSSNEMGLTADEIKSIDPLQLQMIRQEVRLRYTKAGAHFVIDTLLETGNLIDKINDLLAEGKHP